MASDPRKARSNILLGGEDEQMDEDEVLEDAQVPLPTTASAELIDNFITPSPFAHHVTGPTSSRFRNAVSRISEHPESDVEAWQALMTEVQTCYRSIKNIHAVDAELQLQLDWMESCYGCLLKYFPYSSAHYVAVAEMLFRQSARMGEEEGPIGVSDPVRSNNCQRKLERVFEKTLGVYMDGSPISVGDESDNENDEDSDKKNESAIAEEIGGMCTSNADLWMLYIRTRIRQARRELQPSDETTFRQWSTKAFELAIDHAGFGFTNHVVWKAYLAFAKSQTNDPQLMLNLRGIYQRLVCHPMTGLDQLWQEYEAFERQQSEALAAALVSEYTPKYQHARTVYLERNRVFNIQDLQMTKLATPPNPEEMQDEEEYLQLWKKRCAYERTNPERLNPGELIIRVRQAYKEMACVLTKHPEVWHMWSMWEETLKGGGDEAIHVLQIGQTHILDCTLLAYAQAQLTELHTSTPSRCLAVMASFLERAPNTLGYALYQQMVRRHKGRDAARAVFSKARRVLLALPEKEGSSEKETSGEAEGESSKEATIKQEENGKSMITNRLDESIGNNHNKETNQPTKHTDDSNKRIQPGHVTWHLYASHATIEHRLNNAPEIAARIYELGLRKHASFLTKSPYVLRYAQLLLELRDNVNLRALLTRALSACEQLNSKSTAALWDMTLQFESLVAIADPTNVAAAMAVERRRREALMGPDVEDVATGGFAGDSVGIGAQKSTVAEQLVRQDGYNMSSIIVNGLSRTVDCLDIMGLWGNNSNSSRFVVKEEDDDDENSMPGGKSDASFQRRLRFSQLVQSGGMMNVDGMDTGGGSKLLSARERLQQQANPGAQNTAISMAIQQSPEWLRPLLMMLPASRNLRGIWNKPPPHLTEMALATMRQNNLPAERPQDDANISGNKHARSTKAGAGDDSSDEENGGSGSGGYGLAFRARQRARQIASTQSMQVNN